jgi:heme-degrading monooxygenase HmoA
MPLARTPKPPYYTVIFSSLRTEDDGGYSSMARRMEKLAATQAGFLGMESAREADGLGLTVSYWRDLESILLWKQDAEHLVAQKAGREKWYSDFTVRIAQVQREYSL